MASGMAHELSQPLNIIHMTAEGALIELDSVRPAAADPSPEALAPTLQSLHDAVNRIANQAGRMGQVLDHIRIFSRRDSGPAELFDAAVVMRRAQDSLQSSVPDALTAPVMGHPVQLEQVLINLLINAKEAVLASRNGSPTSARSPRGWIRLAAQRLGSDLQIQIQDSGSGIPDDQLARLFEPFYTTKDAGGGPGLGLSVAYGIITTMGGKLTAQNSAHGGAVFELRIPHLLFIERAPGALMAMRMHLARKGYLTSTAETLPEAEAVARSHSLSLVLTDHLVATNAEGPICPSILSAIRTVDPSLPILGLVAHHPLPVASGGGLTQSTRPLNGGTNEAPVHVIRQAVGLSDLYDIVQSIQRTG
jgi:hypothetical protein